MLKLTSEQGDTIVEVLIALTILAMAFSIAFAISNRSLQEARNAQEHSAALQYLSGQVEHVRAQSGDAAVYASPGTPFCLDPSSGAVVRPYVTATCTVPGPVGYVLQVKQTSTDTFTFDVTWQGVGQLGNQHEQLFYKVHQ